MLCMCWCTWNCSVQVHQHMMPDAWCSNVVKLLCVIVLMVVCRMHVYVFVVCVHVFVSVCIYICVYAHACVRVCVCVCVRVCVCVCVCVCARLPMCAHAQPPVFGWIAQHSYTWNSDGICYKYSYLYLSTFECTLLPLKILYSPQKELMYLYLCLCVIGLLVDS